MSGDEAAKLVEECAARLGEHFDAVQIFVSRPGEGGGTDCYKRGCGNWYARRGMAQEFISQDQAQNLAEEIARLLPPDEDGEAWAE